MSNFTSIVKNKLLEAINHSNMLEGTADVLVGFSGGADSVCLLHALHSLSEELNFTVRAAHVNHNIRGDEAKHDELFCESFCKERSIPFEKYSFNCVEEAKRGKESLEECGRRVRYGFFESLCTQQSKIATAHNANDNAETVIFNLSRGSSIKGVCGIPAIRGNIIRPLIYCTREEIEGYCAENNLQYVTDSTNLCDDYTRNKIRHNILPVMSSLNSGAISNITAFCENAQVTADFISAEAHKALEDAFIEENVYNAEILKRLHKAVLREAISIAFFQFANTSIDHRKIEAVISLVHNTGRTQLYGEKSAEVVKNRLRFYNSSHYSVDGVIEVSGVGKYDFGNFSITVSEFTDCSEKLNNHLSDNLIDCDKINGRLFLRAKADGDKITLKRRNVTKSLKKLFNENNIPVEQRKNFPVLCDNEGVVWVYKFGTDARCHISDSSSNIICVKGENNG